MGKLRHGLRVKNPTPGHPSGEDRPCTRSASKWLGWLYRVRYTGVRNGETHRLTHERGPDTNDSLAHSALTFILPTCLDAFWTTLCTFSLLGVVLGILSGPFLLIFFLPNIFVVGSLLHPPLAFVLVHFEGPLERLGGFNEAPNAGLGLGKLNQDNRQIWTLVPHWIPSHCPGVSAPRNSFPKQQMLPPSLQLDY